MTLRTITALAAVTLLGAGLSGAFAQSVEQHNAPGGPRQRVENLVGKSGLTLPPPPPTPPARPVVSTTTVTSPPATPPKK